MQPHVSLQLGRTAQHLGAHRAHNRCLTVALASMAVLCSLVRQFSIAYVTAIRRLIGVLFHVALQLIPAGKRLGAKETDVEPIVYTLMLLVPDLTCKRFLTGTTLMHNHLSVLHTSASCR